MATRAADKRDYSIDAIAQTLRILKSFLDEGREVQSVTEISERLALNRSRVFRILSTLEAQAFVRQDPQSKRYRLGLKLFELGQQVARSFDVARVAEPALAELTQQTQETSYIYLLDGQEAVPVAKREPKQAMRLSVELGRRDRLTVGAACNLLLAYLSPEEIDKVLGAGPLPQLTSRTVTEPAALKKKLADIRRANYNLTRGEEQEGIDAIAAPIRDSRGQVVAAVAIAGPSLRFTPDRTTRFLSLVQQAASKISREIGYSNASYRPPASATH